MSHLKVLIACPINQRKQYCIAEYFSHLGKITYPDVEFYFVDNSVDERWHYELMKTYGYEVDYVSPRGKKNNQYIVESQNKIRERAILNDFDYLFFIECDILPEPNIVEEFLAYEYPIVVGRYFVGEDEHTKLFGSRIEEPAFGRYTNRHQTGIETYLEYGTKKTKAKMFGLGVCMIHRSILMQYQFEVLPYLPDHADTMFWFWCYERGIYPKIHERIYPHKSSSWQLVNDFSNASAVC